MDDNFFIKKTDITFQQIQDFLVIAKCRSLSKAAEELFISQPALSKSLKRFEQRIGVPLFERSNHGVVLTEAGKNLFVTFKSLIENLDRSVQWARESIESKKSLHMAVPVNYDFSSDYSQLKDFIDRYEKKYTNVEVVLSLFDLKTLCSAFEYGGIDLVFLPSFAAGFVPFIKHKRFSELGLYVVVNKDMGIETLEDLKRFESLPVMSMAFSEELPAEKFVEDMCKKLGFSPDRIAFPPNMQTLLHGVIKNAGIGICWNMECYDDKYNLRFIRIPHDISDQYLNIAWTDTNISKEAQWAINMVKEP